MIEPRQISVVGTTVIKHYDGWTQVILPTGDVVNGVPTYDQKAAAEEMGFADIDAMCQAHDPMHVVLCELLGIGCSYALRLAAREQGMSEQEHILAGLEEDAVLAVLKFQQHHKNVQGRKQNVDVGSHDARTVD